MGEVIPSPCRREKTCHGIAEYTHALKLSPCDPAFFFLCSLPSQKETYAGQRVERRGNRVGWAQQFRKAAQLLRAEARPNDGRTFQRQQYAYLGWRACELPSPHAQQAQNKAVPTHLGKAGQSCGGAGRALPRAAPCAQARPGTGHGKSGACPVTCDSQCCSAAVAAATQCCCCVSAGAGRRLPRGGHSDQRR